MMLIFSVYNTQIQNDVARFFAEYSRRYHVPAPIIMFLTWAFGFYFTINGYS